MRAHIIENGVVINTIVVADLDVIPSLISAENGGNIGDSWDGEIFTTPTKKPLVPTEVTRFQALAALEGVNLLDTLETIMADPQTPKLTKLAYQNALTFERQSPTVAVMAGVLGLTEEQLDALFITAGQIKA